MALPPKFAGQRFLASEAPAQALHMLELYLDYVCPFSAKMFNTVYTSVIPLIKQKYASKVQIIFRQQIQPWHPSSTLVHEAGVAVLTLSPQKFYPFSASLFKQQNDFFDTNVVNETRNATYKRLAKIGGEVGIDEEKMYDLLKIDNKPNPDGSMNSGNGVTNQLKVLVKMNRLVGIHVTPTVVFDGVVENSISSSFTADQWEEWLDKNVA
ncbi:hypothetical protein BCON_0045g00070 [Botryotinia convoluta]|uniref:Thioredoxin-like fold domain-containing protein n=1 Tax=Botryotinia convoluta TaxID=54673 RepID=A0A4Z1ID38_9HELO|nr:hypothetical protein BCON_0045g00070 [Botryotinia convoluta]